MGARLSLNNQKVSCNKQLEMPQSEVCKRQRTSSCPQLIPNLPDEISIQILARIPRISHFNSKLVSRRWKVALTSTECYEVRKELNKTEEWLYVLTKLNDERLAWHALDPVSRMWQRLPLLPNVVAGGGVSHGMPGFGLWNIVSSNSIADAIRGWLGRRSRFVAVLAIGAVDGCLYMIGGFYRASAMKSVWRQGLLQDRCLKQQALCCCWRYSWSRWTDSSSVSRGFDPCSGAWSEIPSMAFSKAQVLPTAFLADLLKPIATGMTSYRGKAYIAGLSS